MAMADHPDKAETYRGVDILKETTTHTIGGNPIVTVRYHCVAVAGTLRDDSLDGIKKQIDSILDKFLFGNCPKWSD